MSVETNVASAVAYYEAFAAKDRAGIARHLHPEVQFIGPLAELAGKEAVLEALMRLLNIVRGIRVRAKFGAEDGVMLAYDLDCAPPIGLLRVAALLSFRDGLISRIEIFFDARPFGAR